MPDGSKGRRQCSPWFFMLRIGGGVMTSLQKHFLLRNHGGYQAPHTQRVLVPVKKKPSPYYSSYSYLQWSLSNWRLCRHFVVCKKEKNLEKRSRTFSKTHSTHQISMDNQKYWVFGLLSIVRYSRYHHQSPLESTVRQPCWASCRSSIPGRRPDRLSGLLSLLRNGCWSILPWG
jgi:hypothetical protein